MFGRNINRCCESGILACNAGNMNNMLWLLVLPVAEEMRNSQLCGANWMRKVYVNQGIPATGW